MGHYAICTWVIIAITVWTSYRGFRDQGFVNKYIFWPEAILAGKEYRRLVSSGFLHRDWIHLGMNMLTLYFFGPLVELVCGPAQFLAIYFGSVIGGDLLALYLHRHQDYRALGASGGVCGVMFAQILMFPYGMLRDIFFQIPVPCWLYALGFLIFTFYRMHRKLDDIGHDAHLGGALAGFFLMAAMHPQLVRIYPIWFSAISVGAILLLVYLVKNPMGLPMQGYDFASSQRPAVARPASWKHWVPTFRRRDRDSATAGTTERRLDAILQKISEKGIDSLTEAERQLLNDASRKYQRRAIRENRKWHFPF